MSDQFPSRFAYQLPLTHFTVEDLKSILVRSPLVRDEAEKYAAKFGLSDDAAKLDEFAKHLRHLTGGIPGAVAQVLLDLDNNAAMKEVAAAVKDNRIEAFLLDRNGEAFKAATLCLNLLAPTGTMKACRDVIMEAYFDSFGGEGFSTRDEKELKTSQNPGQSVKVKYHVLLSQLGLFVDVDATGERFKTAFPVPVVHQLQKYGFGLVDPDIFRFALWMNRGDRFEKLCVVDLLWRTFNPSHQRAPVPFNLLHGLSGCKAFEGLELPCEADSNKHADLEGRIKVVSGEVHQVCLFVWNAFLMGFD